MQNTQDMGSIRDLAELKGAGWGEREKKGDDFAMLFPVCLGSQSTILVSQSLWGQGSVPEEMEQVVCWPQSPRSRRQPSRDWRSWVNTLGSLS